MITLTGVSYPTILMGALGLVFGALLAYASIKFFVKTDDRVGRIRELLPGANCGGCGYPGCDGYANGIVNGGAKTNLCAAGGAPLAKGIASIMGVEPSAAIPVRSFLKCGGTPECSARNAVYDGIQDCKSASVLPGGSPNACPFGCMGLGTCVKVCVFDAISIVDGLASIDPEKCVGCGTCVATCPKSALALVPRQGCLQVACSSKWRGPDVKRVCSAGCIGCGLCARNCPAEAITVDGNLARVDGLKCTNCGTCASKCPTHCISFTKKAIIELQKSA
jgi:Na+-translocating ferredoxin:NAD+ oxidoreductase RNF subunit RnfB